MTGRGAREPRRRGARGPWTALLALLLLLPASSASAQVVSGRLLDGSTRNPISDGRVQLLDPDGTVVATDESDASGGFRLEAPGPGDYYIRGERLGYTSRTDGVLELGEGGQLTIEFYLRAAPIQLDTVRATVEGWRVERHLESQGFYERLDQGFGHFITPEDLSRIRPADPSDLLRNIPGARVFDGWPSRSVYFRVMGDYCEPRIFVDGIEVNDMAPGAALGEVVEVEAVSGIEVYNRPSSVPLQYGGTGASCGLILVWTVTGAPG